MVSLNESLQRFHHGFLDRLGPADARLLQDAQAGQVAAGQADDALREGQAAPDFALRGAGGETVRLSALLASGPAVLVFVRGGVFPLCALTLRAWQAALPALRRRGAALLAISAEPAARLHDTIEDNGIGFPVLSDADGQVAAAYGLRHELPVALRDLYTRLGHPGPDVTCCRNWQLPLPAGFLVAGDGLVKLAQADPRPYVRLEPARVLAALDALAGNVTRLGAE